MHQRKNMLGSRQALQAILPNIDQARPRWQLVGHQFGRPLGKQDMTTVGQRPQPGRPIQRLAVVVTVAQLGFPAVQRGSGRKRDALRPALSRQYLLERQRGSHGVGGSNEHGKGWSRPRHGT